MPYQEPGRNATRDMGTMGTTGVGPNSKKTGLWNGPFTPSVWRSRSASQAESACNRHTSPYNSWTAPKAAIYSHGQVFVLGKATAGRQARDEQIRSGFVSPEQRRPRVETHCEKCAGGVKTICSA
jgi:hypothetical protein